MLSLFTIDYFDLRPSVDISTGLSSLRRLLVFPDSHES